MESADQPRSMRPFFVVWLGQLVSVTGTTITAFGLQIYVFTETGSVTQLTFVALAFVTPALVLAPLAGSVVDRYDRRVVMLVADACAGVATLGLFIVWATGVLEPWHIYLATAVGSSANAFQDPAWMAAVPLLVPKDQLGRANGLVQLNQGLSFVLAPAIAGALLALGGLGPILIIDAATFAVGVATLALVRFPAYARTAGEDRSVWQDSVSAWRYLRIRSGLLGLLIIYAGVNFMLSATNVLVIPLIVSFSTEAAAGAVLSIAGLGAVVGSLAVGVLGTPKRLVATIMGGIAVIGVFVSMVGMRESVVIVGIAATLLLFLNPVVNSSSQVIWQTKVEEGMQGRVFSLRRMLSSAVSPLAIFIAGPLADQIFEPMLAEDGALADTVGTIIGTGPGRGIGFMYVVAGIGTVGLGIAGWLAPRVRNIETELPDLAGRS
jgi:DHA3 family macrolide efflux protein-like MFS transporter